MVGWVFHTNASNVFRKGKASQGRLAKGSIKNIGSTYSLNQEKGTAVTACQGDPTAPQNI